MRSYCTEIKHRCEWHNSTIDSKIELEDESSGAVARVWLNHVHEDVHDGEQTEGRGGNEQYECYRLNHQTTMKNQKTMMRKSM